MGHSAGGLNITQACHKFSNKIRLAVYVAATMLKLGFLTDQDLKDVSHFHKLSHLFLFYICRLVSFKIEFEFILLYVCFFLGIGVW